MLRARYPKDNISKDLQVRIFSFSTYLTNGQI